VRRVAGLLNQALNRAPGREQLYAAVVLEATNLALREILPPETSRRIRPYQYKGGVVTLVASSSVAASEVRMQSETILPAIAKILERRGIPKSPQEIRVRIGSVRNS
jgi:hypothetical protein